MKSKFWKFWGKFWSQNFEKKIGKILWIGLCYELFKLKQLYFIYIEKVKQVSLDRTDVLASSADPQCHWRNWFPQCHLQHNEKNKFLVFNPLFPRTFSTMSLNTSLNVTFNDDLFELSWGQTDRLTDGQTITWKNVPFTPWSIFEWSRSSTMYVRDYENGKKHKLISEDRYRHSFFLSQQLNNFYKETCSVCIAVVRRGIQFNRM